MSQKHPLIIELALVVLLVLNNLFVEDNYLWEILHSVVNIVYNIPQTP